MRQAELSQFLPCRASSQELREFGTRDAGYIIGGMISSTGEWATPVRGASRLFVFSGSTSCPTPQRTSKHASRTRSWAAQEHIAEPEGDHATGEWIGRKRGTEWSKFAQVGSGEHILVWLNNLVRLKTLDSWNRLRCESEWVATSLRDARQFREDELRPRLE
jgi:hypothetical protein